MLALQTKSRQLLDLVMVDWRSIFTLPIGAWVEVVPYRKEIIPVQDQETLILAQAGSLATTEGPVSVSVDLITMTVSNVMRREWFQLF